MFNHEKNTIEVQNTERTEQQANNNYCCTITQHLHIYKLPKQPELREFAKSILLELVELGFIKELKPANNEN